MIVSAFLYSLQNVDARFSGNIFGFWTMCVFRGIVGSVVCICLLFLERNKGDYDLATLSVNRNIPLLLLRSVLGGATIITSFFAILKCDLSTTTIITATSSLWTALIGHIICPDKYRWEFHDLLIALWCIGGIVVMSSGKSHDGYYYIGVISAVSSSILQAGVNLTIKQLDTESPAWVALWGMGGSLVLGMPGLIYEITTQKPHFSDATLIEWESLASTGFLSATAQYFKTYSIQISGSMSILILRYMDAIFSVVWDIVIFHEKLRWQIIAGMLIILSGCLTKLGLDNYYKRKNLLPLDQKI
jgi:drug/metabolite transporter (DMT)-like permease